MPIQNNILQLANSAKITIFANQKLIIGGIDPPKFKHYVSKN